ncbi:MAG: DNRLRE domain-containing protein [Verrucomicrobiota bacterium]
MTFKPYPNTGFHRSPGETLASIRNPLLKTLLAAALGVAAAVIPAGAKPLSHNIPAANFNVVQNSTSTTATTAVTVTAPLSINDFQVRTGSVRGVYNVRVGTVGIDDFADGFLMTSISQNGRTNLAESPNPIYGASTFGTNSQGFFVAAYDVTTNRATYNANCAAGYFYYTNWLCGWARNASASNGGTNNLFTGSPGLALGTHFKGITGGESRVDLRSLGIASTNNPGILLVNHGKNEGNFALSVANPDGTWEIYLKDNFGTAANPLALEQDPVAFVYVPKTKTNVVSGKFGLDATGTNAQILIYSGNSPAFAVTNIDIGRYRLTIPGYSPAYGVLLVSPEGGFASNFDNIVSYQADGDGWIIESRDTGAYPPPLEACTNETVASFVFIPTATPGFSVTPSGTLLTTEFGTAANFSVTLDTAPTSDVTINVSSSDLTEGTVSPTSLTFTPANWNVAHTVTVTGVDDVLADGSVDYTVVLSPAVSSDAAYNGLDPADVPVRNLDDDVTEITVSPTNGLTTTEAGGTATFSVSLSRLPSGNVTIGLSSSDLTEGTVSPSSLVFTPADWSTAKTVTITGVNDFKPDGNISYTIVTAPAVSTDAGYNNLDPADVSVSNSDDDVAGLVWHYSLPIVVNEGGSTNYSVNLATQPDSNVVVEVLSSSTAVGTVFPGTLTFTPLDWSTPKVVTVSGVENLTANGNVNFTIANNIITDDPIYSQLITNFTLPAVVIDNEPQPSFAAANLNVVQNDTGNTEASVTVTTSLSINDMKVRTGSNRGDYNLRVGDDATDDLAGGLVMVAVSQNGRYNLDESSEPFYGAPAFDGNANGYWAVLQDCTDARGEYNVNCSVAYFRYQNWLAGWARNVTAVNGGTNDLFTGSPGLTLGNQFKGISSGRSRVDLRSFGIYSTNSGVLMVNHAKNEGNYSTSVANTDGTWEVYVKDNFGTAANPLALEQDPTAFVFIPKTNTTVVSGKFGLNAAGQAQTLIYSGNTPAFAVTNIADGRYRLTIPGATPAQGVLIISAEGGYASNFDNVVSYEADGDGWIIESRDTGVYPPVLEACTNEPVASFVFFPAVPPGFTVAPNDILNTTEFGKTANFTVQLATRPASDVTIALSSSNPSEGTVSPASFTFTPANWNAPQTATITGQDDAVADGPVSYTIVLAPAVSADPDYNGLNPADVSVVNLDDEQAGITVFPTVGLLTSESGSSTTFSVFLNHQPTHDVTIGFSSSKPGEGTVAPSSLTFTPADWSTPKLVNVTGVDDFHQDGDVNYTIITAPAVSSDPSYNGLKGSDVSVRNLDNDVPGYVWDYSLPLTVIEGQSVTYSLKLATQPFSNVVIQATSDNLAAGTISPSSRTFTPLNWNTPQTFTLTGVDNFVANPDVSFNIIHTPVTTDPTYSQLSSAITLPAIAVDNEAKFTLPSGDCVYGLGMPPIGIDGQASLLDPDAVSYNQGVVTVVLTTNSTPQDQISIRSTGTGTAQISVIGTNVSYEGYVIGFFTGGAGSTPLSVTLNDNANIPAVQKLLRSITFFTATNGSTATRSVTFSVGDGVGGLVAASKAIRVGSLRQTQYQEGGDYGYGEYSGANDIALSQVGSSTPWPLGRTLAPTEGLLIDWPDGGTPNESQVLLRFDDFVGTNSWQVPSNAIVVSAELLVNVNNTGDGGKFFRMLVPWDATNDTWNTLGEGVQQDDIESRSIYEAQMGVEDGSGATGVGIITVGVTPDVQAWVNGTNNLGWVIKGWPLMTDGTGFTPSDYSVVAERPRLRVKWLVPAYSSVSFQQGVNDYTNAFDTNLRQATPDVNYVADQTLFSDYHDAGNTNTTEGLLRFDNIIGGGTNQIPPGSLIHAAVLELPSVGNSCMGNGGRFYDMLQPWSDTTVTWNTYGTNGIVPDGIVAATTPSFVAGNSSLQPLVQGTINTYEVTADIQAWVNGTRQNYGWAVLPWTGGTDGWGFRSSKWSSVVPGYAPERERPRLRVYYTAGAVASAAIIKPLVISPSLVNVRFTGTAGFTYHIWRAASLNSAWIDLGAVATDGGGYGSFNDSTPLSSTAFYRVVFQ